MLEHHIKHMKRAIQLAWKAEGRTSPNPMVGAVLVKDGRVIGEGFHQRAGEPHAEIEAIRSVEENCRGATIYVTLEPCCHYGRTPPCSQALIDAGIAEVFYAVRDRNPVVDGGGHRQLEGAGLRVTAGLCEEEATFLNRAFFHFVTHKEPYVTAKYAMSLDGKIATATGESQWITGPQARLVGHRLRNVSDAILVGVNTVLADDPSLTTRIPNEPCYDPVPVILDSKGRVPLGAQIFQKEDRKVVVATTEHMPETLRKALLVKGNVEVLCLAQNEVGRVAVPELLKALAKRQVQRLMVEGGSQVLGAFLQADRIQEVWAFLGARLIGGASAPGPFGGTGCLSLKESLELDVYQTANIGSDFLLKALVKPAASSSAMG